MTALSGTDRLATILVFQLLICFPLLCGSHAGGVPFFARLSLNDEFRFFNVVIPFK